MIGTVLALGFACIAFLMLHRGETNERQDFHANQHAVSPATGLPTSREAITLSAADQAMPADPVFVTNGGFRMERSLRSRLRTLQGITNLIANARAAGLGVYASGPAEMQVRSGVNNVAIAKTDNAFFDVMYSDSLAPSVIEMHGTGRDKNGLPFDVRQFLDDGTDPHVDAVKAWADTRAYPLAWQPAEADSAVANFLAMQIPDFAERYLLESRTQVDRGGYELPFVTYTYAAKNVFKDFSNMNRDAVEVTLRIGGPDLVPGANADLPPTGAVLVNYSDPGVVWRMSKTTTFSDLKQPLK